MRALGLVVILLFPLACTPRNSSLDRKSAPKVDAAPSTSLVEASVIDAGPAKEALPSFPSDELTLRAHHLLEAISKDDPSLASDIVFPRDAYIECKDAADPGKHWDDKVMGAFQRQVHALHKRTKDIERAQYVGFEIGQPISQVVPKKHDISMNLWRVRHSRLTFTIDGKSLRFDLGELMSWKGAWYVIDLK